MTGTPIARGGSVRKQVAAGAATLTVARMLSRGFDMITLIILARHLTPADFGLVAIALSIVQIAEAVLDLPTGSALLQLPSVTRHHLNTTFTLNLLRGLALMGFLCAVSYPASLFFGDPRLVGLICALSLAPALRGVRSPKMELLYKRLRFRPDATAEIVGKAAALSIAVLLALETGSYWAIAAGTIASPLLYMATTYVLAPARPRLSLRHWRAFHRYLGWSMGAQAMSAINWQADRFVLGKLAAQATVGLFTTGRDLAWTASKIIFGSLLRPLLAALSRSNADLARQRAVYRQTIATVLSIGLPVACGQALLGPEIVRLILGPKWLSTTIVFQAVSLALIPGFYTGLTTSLLFANGKPELIFSRNMWDLCFRIPVTVGCIVWLGWKGAAVALLAADLFLATLCLQVVKRTIGIGIGDQLAQALRGSVSVAAMIVVFLAFREVLPPAESALGAAGIIALMVPVAAVVYAFVHLLVWRLSGRPEGIEQLGLHLAGSLAARFLAGSSDGRSMTASER
ncbi:lipopolysaccharide biosynthesis protein [Tsuneonella mangrovi]|uniref:lipopolysaccharide biosynthesis protein n=1 Tax=Tsuneonella mangrovi TaxID=1982042 RepID=UPI000BA1D62F|nr:lipopolysaccharide biosynthesis protein [Tsuneonella mangrovi]